jgi:hypothetical protein
MRILYLSCHSILEYDEVKLFTEMGHEVFSLGSYVNPLTPHDPKRPAVDAKPNEYLLNVDLQSSKENLHDRLIEWTDVVMIMHRSDWVLSNWERIKHKRVILRTIGQNQPQTELELSIPRSQGLQIVRYSPEEDKIAGYVGGDAIIRFYKDPDEFTGYNGHIPAVLSVGQSMKERNMFCGYDIFMRASEGLHRNLYGTQSKNPDLSPMDDPLWRGQLSFEDLKKAYQNHRVYFYTGTYPASYTLNFMEAMMTGIPIVAIGRDLANLKIFDMDSYEVDKIIENGVNGFVSNDIEVLRSNLNYLIENPGKAKEIGQRGRERAIELFGKENIRKQWEDFLK